MTRFNAVRTRSGNSPEFGVTVEHTLEIDPEIIRVEDLEFTDCMDERV